MSLRDCVTVTDITTNTSLLSLSLTPLTSIYFAHFKII
uniref:Uncharacterized protein n=1 Tax=Amphimedon queenslandica TaxID=400682 RepID=A0A1X7UII5_AMPQE